MTLLKTVAEHNAQGTVKKVYNGFQQVLGRIPNVIKFHTVSQRIFPYYIGLVNEFAEHPTLEPKLLGYMRTIVSHREGGEYCIKFQSFILKGRGETQENVDRVLNDPSTVNLDEKQKRLLLFALDFLYGKIENVEHELDALRKIGWTDQEIYELAFLGGLQRSMVPLIKGFKVEHDF